MAISITLPIVDVQDATPRSRIVRLGTRGVAFPFRAGQAIYVGTHGQPLRKPYSIASAPEETAQHERIELLIGVGTSGTPGPHLERLDPGVVVDVEGPIGRFVFPDSPDARQFLFIAGGSGISPLRSMMRHALATEPQFPTGSPPIGLIYSARTKDEFAYAEEFERLAADGAIALMLTVTRPEDEGSWAGARGRINLTHLRQMIRHEDTLCFICGPQTLVDDVKPLLREAGVAEERIRVEEW
jgi:ring-1,2-phenylacetyl-CoA epoxidase subunit PaaE